MSIDRPTTPSVPLVVDLDGTLIKTDLMWVSIAQLMRRNPLMLFAILFWWTRGRAFLKQQLGRRVTIDPAALPYNEKFVSWLREEKKSGRKIILATASDLKLAKPVADYSGLFDDVLASDGKTNLRSANKLKALTQKFGERGFDYAGNSTADYVVWRGVRQAIVVNASGAVTKRAHEIATVGATFNDDFSSLEIAKTVCRELFIRSGYLEAIGAGIVLATAFPKLNLAGFAWIAPALMLAAARGKSGPDAARVGYIAGLAFWLTTLYWLLLIPVAGFPILGWVALSAYLALFSAAWVWLVQPGAGRGGSWSQRTAWALGGASVWVAIEMFRSWFLGGFPWSLLGVSQYKIVPLIQVASITGVYGVSFIIVWFSLSMYSAARKIFLSPTKRHVWQAEIAMPLIVVVLIFVAGMFRMGSTNPPSKPFRVTSIQPSIPQSLIWSTAEDDQRFQRLLMESKNALTNQADLLLWPESAVPQTDENNDRAISLFAKSNHVWMVFNGDDVEFKSDTTNWFNSAFIVDPNGVWLNVYHKRKLVIFGEYVPFTKWLPFLKYFTPIVGGWTPGEKAVTFYVRRQDEMSGEHVIELNNGSPTYADGIKISPLICFEDVFPTMGREASADDTDFLVNLTNDGWFGQSAEQWQHMANAVFRAVENGLPLVRCANNGVTCWIDAHGRVHDILTDKNGSVYGIGAATFEIPVLPEKEKTATFYHRHGDWFGWICVGASALMLIAKLRNNFRNRF